MASAGSNANASAAQQFWDYFHRQKRTIDEKVANNEDVSQMVRDLDLALREALVYLPPYDQKQLSKELESLRLAVQQQGRRAADGNIRGKAGGGFKFKSAKTTTKLAGKKTQNSDGIRLPPTSQPNTGVATALADDKQTNVSSVNNNSSFVFANLTGERKVVGVPQTAESDATDCELRDISNSIVDLRQVSGSLRALNCHKLRNSIVLCGPFAGSATMRDSVNCILVLGVRQMRLENSTHIDVYLHCSSRPIIEKSSAIRFATYPSSLSPRCTSSANSSDLLALPNMFDNVDDFNWLKRQHSPNWSVHASPLGSSAWTTFETDTLDDLIKLLPQSH
ncbi:hypothetical protein LPJ59_006347 [Coemansia sp. RSA 2399]|nr:hypothetical protein LPJ59_006347 [Coemansia sp. RSA 2399]KAJ1888517.1 hypothetical protein LPJ81_006301 [Coemansia sp. IMI 209127]